MVDTGYERPQSRARFGVPAMVHPALKAALRERARETAAGKRLGGSPGTGADLVAAPGVHPLLARSIRRAPAATRCA